MNYEYTTTWAKGMNTRPQPNVNNSPNGAVGYGQLVNGVEIWTAPADGVNVRKNDTWLRLDDPVTKWVAVVHMGVVYGVVTEGNNTEPPKFPESFKLVYPTGESAEYQFVRVIE